LEELRQEAQTYVSLPSDDPLKPSLHNTGGAIDLIIIGPNRVPLNMGTEFDHFGPEASARYYEERILKPEEEIIRNNRRLLYNAMVNVGFSGYDEEWWHFDFGNQFDAARTNKTYAEYGPISINN
jgi:D-alanyl-D-alanine dipeptidase